MAAFLRAPGDGAGSRLPLAPLLALSTLSSVSSSLQIGRFRASADCTQIFYNLVVAVLSKLCQICPGRHLRPDIRTGVGRLPARASSHFWPAQMGTVARTQIRKHMVITTSRIARVDRVS